MSGLLERIVRRRRASASTPLGPRSQNGSQPESTNGHAPALPHDAAAEPLAEATAPLPEPHTAPAPPAPTFLQRGRIRRRARYLRRLREVQLRDLGGFLVELHRFGRERPELVRSKL